jgi:hypothetical protein
MSIFLTRSDALLGLLAAGSVITGRRPSEAEALIELPPIDPELCVLFFNTHLLPAIAQSVAGHRGQDDYRTSVIGAAVAPYDLIGLCEVFESHRREEIVPHGRPECHGRLSREFRRGRLRVPTANELAPSTWRTARRSLVGGEFAARRNKRCPRRRRVPADRLRPTFASGAPHRSLGSTRSSRGALSRCQSETGISLGSRRAFLSAHCEDVRIEDRFMSESP